MLRVEENGVKLIIDDLACFCEDVFNAQLWKRANKSYVKLHNSINSFQFCLYE